MRKTSVLSVVVILLLMVAVTVFMEPPSLKDQLQAGGELNGIEDDKHVKVTALALAPHQQGTDIDGNVDKLFTEGLEVNTSLKEFFDYTLSSLTDVELEELIAGMDSMLDDNLSVEDALKAKKIFKDYVDYKTALDSAVDGRELPEDVADRMAYILQEKQDLRREYLGDDVAGDFFAEEEVYDQYTVDRLRLHNQTDLSDEDRAAEAQRLFEQLPEEEQEAIHEMTSYADMMKADKVINENALDRDDVMFNRIEKFGYEVAERMQATDDTNDEFNDRIDQFLEQKNTILSDQGLDEDTRIAEVNYIKESYFTVNELKRIDTIVAIRNSRKEKSTLDVN